MKKLVLIAAALTLAVPAFAQSTPTTPSASAPTTETAAKPAKHHKKGKKAKKKRKKKRTKKDAKDKSKKRKRSPSRSPRKWYPTPETARLSSSLRDGALALNRKPLTRA